MIEDTGLETECAGARFTLTAHSHMSPFTRLSLAAIAVAALCMLPAVAIGVSRYGWGGWSGALLLAVILTSVSIFALIIAYLLSPRTLVTVFDRDAKSIVMDFSIFKNLYARRTALSFADIEGVGVRAVDLDNENVWSFEIVMFRKDGKVIALELANSVDGLEQEICEHIVQKLCEATGLARLDKIETGNPAHRPNALIPEKMARFAQA